MPKIKVVLADDEEHLGFMVKYKLEASGFDVVWKKNGRDALESVRAEKPDVVVLDVMMPGMGGYDVLKEIKADPGLKDTPVVLLTARSQESDILRGIELGAADYVTKPFRPAELVARIKRLVPSTP